MTTNPYLNGNFAPLTEAAPVQSLVNTHANGDHCYGNGAVTSSCSRAAGRRRWAAERSRRATESSSPPASWRRRARSSRASWDTSSRTSCSSATRRRA